MRLKNVQSTPSLGHCSKLVCHLPIFWSYWRYEARHRAGSDPCCEVCRRRARVGRAQSPPVGGGRVARYRLRRRRGGFVGHRSGSGDDSQGTPGDFPRRGADGPHPTPWRRKASHPAGSTRHPGRRSKPWWIRSRAETRPRRCAGRFTGNGITNCYPDEVDNFVSITALTRAVSRPEPTHPMRTPAVSGSSSRPELVTDRPETTCRNKGRTNDAPEQTRSR